MLVMDMQVFVRSTLRLRGRGIHLPSVWFCYLLDVHQLNEFI